MGSKNPVRPPRLAPGARVALVAPAGPLLEQDDLARAAELCRALGWEPVLGANAAAQEGYLAGADALRAADLNAALRDDRVAAVWCIRGGYGLTRILDQLDFAATSRQPKVVLGFSDVTALLLALHHQVNLVTFHGPIARYEMPDFTREHLERVITQAAPAGLLRHLPGRTGVLVPEQNRVVTIAGGRAEGPLIGGNLSLIQCLVGTPYLPDLTGAILFLEDVGEELYRVDRMLSHLRLAGVLGRLAGVAIGRFTEMGRRGADGATGFDRVLSHYFQPLGIPVLSGLPFGHVREQWTLPVGVRARLDAGAGELELLDAAVT
ncbi:MAG TPA: LD-carboxypeptidase [Gemmatimonadales bacterium]|nr:LD-carboxypeptidase [Gemmatimonadales bacterium]